MFNHQIYSSMCWVHITWNTSHGEITSTFWGLLVINQLLLNQQRIEPPGESVCMENRIVSYSLLVKLTIKVDLNSGSSRTPRLDYARLPKQSTTSNTARGHFNGHLNFLWVPPHDLQDLSVSTGCDSPQSSSLITILFDDGSNHWIQNAAIFYYLFRTRFRH